MSRQCIAGPYMGICGFDALLKGSSAVVWRFSCTFHILPALGHTPRSLYFSAQFPTDLPTPQELNLLESFVSQMWANFKSETYLFPHPPWSLWSSCLIDSSSPTLLNWLFPTSLISDPHPRVSWSHLRWWTGTRMLKHGVMDNLWLNRSPITKSHSGLDQEGRSTQTLPSRYHSHCPHWALKSPSRTMGSPVGALSTTPPRNSKMVRYSLLLFGLWRQTATHLFQNPCCVWRGAQLTLAGTSQPLAQVQAWHSMSL